MIRKAPDPLDLAVGARIRGRRRRVGVSQSELGAALGLSFHQISRYELGLNRLTVSRLLQVAACLDCTLPDLVDGLATAPPILEPASRALMVVYRSLPAEDRQAVREFATSLAEANRRKRSR